MDIVKYKLAQKWFKERTSEGLEHQGIETSGIAKTARVIVLQKCCKTQSVPFPSYIVLFIRCKVIFVSIKVSYLE